MAVITKITTQKKNKERFNVFLDNGKDGEVYGFSVDQDIIVKFQLKKGLEVDELDLTEIQFDDEVKKASNLALHFLSHRMRSHQEVITYLKGKEVDEQIIPEVIHKLEEYEYLNDREFATAYVRTQINTTLKGPNVIKRELFEKGIEQSIINDSLQEFRPELQIEAARKILEKTTSRSKNLSNIVQKQKNEQSLLRKGFSWDTIGLVLEESDTEQDSDEQWESLVYQGQKAHRKYQKFEGFQYKQKMKQALYQKGFAIDQIEKFLETLEEEE